MPLLFIYGLTPILIAALFYQRYSKSIVINKLQYNKYVLNVITKKYKYPGYMYILAPDLARQNLYGVVC